MQPIQAQIEEKDKNWWVYAALLAFSGASFLMDTGLVSPVIIAGYNLHLSDWLAMALIGVATVRLVSRGWHHWLELIPLYLLCYSIIGLVIGLQLYGKQAGLDFRNFFFMLALLYFVSLSPLKPTLKTLIYGSAAIAGFAVLLYVSRMTGMLSFSQDLLVLNITEGFAAVRALGASDAVALPVFAIVCWSAHVRSDSFTNKLVWQGLTYASCLLIIVVMVRTVWVVAVAGLLVMFFLQILYRERVFGSLLGMVLGVTVGAFVIVLLLDQLPLAEAWDTMFEDKNSLEWRYEGWRGLLEKLNFFTGIFGNGFGADSYRYIFENFVNYSAHNAYVSYLFYLGGIGLGLYLAIYLVPLFALQKIIRNPLDPEERIVAMALVSLLVMFMIFDITYADWAPQLFIKGFAIRFIVYAMQRRQAFDVPAHAPSAAIGAMS